MASSPGRESRLFFRSISYVNFDSETHRLIASGSQLMIEIAAPVGFSKNSQKADAEEIEMGGGLRPKADPHIGRSFSRYICVSGYLNQLDNLFSTTGVTLKPSIHSGPNSSACSM